MYQRRILPTIAHSKSASPTTDFAKAALPDFFAPFEPESAVTSTSRAVFASAFLPLRVGAWQAQSSGRYGMVHSQQQCN